MTEMTQSPSPESFLLKWRGDTLDIALHLDKPRKGRAAFRTNIGGANVRRREIIAETEHGDVPMARAWTDIPLVEVAPGKFSASIPLDEVGIFSGKACFFPEGSNVPEWPEGTNLHVKVESDLIRSNNSIYTVFPRQFGSFREIVRRLPTIMDRMGFKIIQTLPPFPVPTTYAVMGEYGCPFAATDFFSVDPAMAEFDEKATPIDQFRELIDAVHSRRGLFFVDLPANHTGWASSLQTHHPEWFRHEEDGRFHSPGAWGVKWADLVELDYDNPELRSYMAEVFLFWCKNGVDGFRCDAGYMIPAKTWEYIVARVREEYPDTVFMLEGLGGDLKITDSLLAEANLDWAYSEVFQTYDRGQFEWYLPAAIERSEKFGTLVHFAETHDNDRLAKKGEVYARLRVQLAALLSWQGAWGIANGVEWYSREKIDVHGRNDLNWGAENNMVDMIARLNRVLATNPAFFGSSHLEVITRGEGNTLAVLRTASNGVKALVLANLDCENGAEIKWDRTKFPGSKAVVLAPGEVKLLDEEVATTADSPKPVVSEKKAQFHIVMPRDLGRIAVVPENQSVEISAPHHFRFELVDPENGRTIRGGRSGEGNKFVFSAPHYHGSGSECRKLTIKITIYYPDFSKRSEAVLMVPPRSRTAKMKIAFTGQEVRKHPEYRTVLSNGAGASTQLRLGWGMILSQYDSVLSANPDPDVPSDRQVLWTRTRCWLQREGYARELDAECTTAFAADPSGKCARWDFKVPCGMGKTASFAFEIALAEGQNAARLRVVRYAGSDNDVEDQVRLVFRPDIENRSFHSTTKAYVVEKNFSSPIEFECRGCVMHEEAQWTYNVAHPEEAERGQESCGDLFSPGWISADLKIGGEMTIVGSWSAKNPVFHDAAYQIPNVGSMSIGEGLRRSMELFIVKRDSLKTVIAGYPWFLDWGRDTFIFMRGMIAAGRIADAVKILKEFASFEENGTLPNIIHGRTAGNRDTVDAQLWFIRCVEEVGADQLRSTCESIVDNYIKGTPNGIVMDSDSGLIRAPSHFTWMDTNYPACTPREGYPIEIQALWISALKYLGRDQLARQALASVKRYFKGENGYADCLDIAGDGSAAQAKPDFAIRPNQLFLITLDVLKDASILKATEELIVPGGMRSLSSENMLYRGRYTGDEDTSRKPAYHNGTVWAWLFPLYAEALYVMKACSREAALSLLASSVEILNRGCVCHLSENADGDAPHRQKGCCAQAWSDSEFLRVWLRIGGK